MNDYIYSIHNIVINGLTITKEKKVTIREILSLLKTSVSQNQQESFYISIICPIKESFDLANELLYQSDINLRYISSDSCRDIKNHSLVSFVIIV